VTRVAKVNGFRRLSFLGSAKEKPRRLPKRRGFEMEDASVVERSGPDQFPQVEQPASMTPTP
jgi:hypothetical protein